MSFREPVRPSLFSNAVKQPLPGLKRSRLEHQTMTTALSRTSVPSAYESSISSGRGTEHSIPQKSPPRQVQGRLVASSVNESKHSRILKLNDTIKPPPKSYLLASKQQAIQANKTINLGQQFSKVMNGFTEYDDGLSSMSPQQPDCYMSFNHPLSLCYQERLHQNIMDHIQQTSDTIKSAGVLQKTGFVYYIFGTVVFFQDLKRHLRRERADTPSKLQFDHEVIAIAQGRFKTKILPQEESKNLLFITHPNKIEIYKAAVQDGELIVQSIGVHTKSSSPRVQDLLVSEKGRVFYTNQKGELVEIQEQTLSKWKVPFSQKRIYLSHKKPQSNVWNQAIQKWKKSSLLNATRTISKRIWSQTKSAIRTTFNGKEKFRVLSLVASEHHKMIFLLLDKGYEMELKCYSFSQKSIEILLMINEKDLFRALKIPNQNYHKQVFILAGLETVNPFQDKCPNLIIGLVNGTRLYLKVGVDKITYIRSVHQPDFDALNIPNIKNPLEPRVVGSIYQCKKDLVSMTHNAGTVLLTFRNSNYNREHEPEYSSYVIARSPVFRAQVIEKVRWATAGKEEVFCSTGKVRCELMTSSNVSRLVRLDRQHRKIRFLDSHELVRQVYLPPQTFYYLTSHGIQTRFKMRPVDIIFALVSSEQLPLSEVMTHIRVMVDNGLHPSEIGCMLMHILLDRHQNYFMDTEFIEKLVTASDKDRRDDSLYLRQNQLSSRTLVVPFREIVPRVYERIVSIINNLQNRFLERESVAINFLDQIKTYPDGNQLLKYTYSNAKDEGFLLYFFRVVRPVWRTSLTLLSKNSVQTKPLLDKLLEIYKYTSVDPLLKIGDSFKLRFNQVVRDSVLRCLQLLQYCKVFDLMPEIEFHQALYLPPSYFQKYIFQSVIRGYTPQKLKEYPRVSYYFMSARIEKTVSLYNNIKRSRKPDDVHEQIKKFGPLPLYLWDYLRNQNHISLDLTFQVEEQPDKLYLDSRLPFLVQDRVKECRSRTLQLQERIKGNIDFVEKEDVIRKLDRQNTTEKILQVQLSILGEFNEKRIYLTPQTVNQLEREVFTQNNLRELVRGLNNPFVDSIYLANFVYPLTKENISLAVENDSSIQLVYQSLKRLVLFSTVREGLPKLLIEVLAFQFAKNLVVTEYIKNVSAGSKCRKQGQDLFQAGLMLISWGFPTQDVYGGFRDALLEVSLDSQNYTLNQTMQTLILVFQAYYYVNQVLPRRRMVVLTWAQKVISLLLGSKFVDIGEYQSILGHFQVD